MVHLQNIEGIDGGMQGGTEDAKDGLEAAYAYVS